MSWNDTASTVVVELQSALPAERCMSWNDTASTVVELQSALHLLKFASCRCLLSVPLLTLCHALPLCCVALLPPDWDITSWTSMICMYMHVYAGIAYIFRYPSVCAGIAGIGPLRHGHHHHVPKTPSFGPAPGRPPGPTQGTPGHVPIHLLTPSQSDLWTRFLDFSMKNRCLGRSGSGRRNRLDPLKRPKHGLLAL
jgi:hypothetical protein